MGQNTESHGTCSYERVYRSWLLLTQVLAYVTHQTVIITSKMRTMWMAVESYWIWFALSSTGYKRDTIPPHLIASSSISQAMLRTIYGGPIPRHWSLMQQIIVFPPGQNPLTNSPYLQVFAVRVSTHVPFHFEMPIQEKTSHEARFSRPVWSSGSASATALRLSIALAVTIDGVKRPNARRDVNFIVKRIVEFAASVWISWCGLWGWWVQAWGALAL